ncbi:hypothetical protein E2C01_099846 [Portunus trituberculatus]|uniref:Uncharacterized protein n=1 Tax=Portunus trituberculatus TaxID=210409 RepID=A0A5B7K1E2_PORTR|nr:hypothetical protein [Portunus trituberculatus]
MVVVVLVVVLVVLVVVVVMGAEAAEHLIRDAHVRHQQQRQQQQQEREGQAALYSAIFRNASLSHRDYFQTTETINQVRRGNVSDNESPATPQSSIRPNITSLGTDIGGVSLSRPGLSGWGSGWATRTVLSQDLLLKMSRSLTDPSSVPLLRHGGVVESCTAEVDVHSASKTCRPQLNLLTSTVTG